MTIETCIVKGGQLDAFHNVFFAETPNGSFQVAHSDKTFSADPEAQFPDAQAALNDLATKLQTQGWQQVVGTIPSPWYNLTFQREVQGTRTIETCIVKGGPQDAFHNLFFAETLDGSFQVAHSDKTFSADPEAQFPDAQAALDDLTTKLQAQGWQQVVGTIPSPWYSIKFQREVQGTRTVETCIVKGGQLDAFHNVFFAETPDGSFQVAHSDKTFSADPEAQFPDAQAALNDLVAKLQAQGWQQVTVGNPSPWYSLEFTRVTYQTS